VNLSKGSDGPYLANHNGRVESMFAAKVFGSESLDYSSEVLYRKFRRSGGSIDQVSKEGGERSDGNRLSRKIKRK
jgi:hypothetical protein